MLGADQDEVNGLTATTGRGTYCTRLASRKRPARQGVLCEVGTPIIRSLASPVSGMHWRPVCASRNCTAKVCGIQASNNLDTHPSFRHHRTTPITAAARTDEDGKDADQGGRDRERDERGAQRLPRRLSVSLRRSRDGCRHRRQEYQTDVLRAAEACSR